MNPDPWGGRDYVIEVARRLWPESRVRIGRRAGPGERGWLLLPRSDRVRLVAPAGTAAGPATIRAAAANRGGGQALGLRAVAGALRFGAAAALPKLLLKDHGSPEAFDAVLAPYLGTADLELSWTIGPPRANRKPVFRVMSPTGEVLSYAKVGLSPLTQRLLATEHDALITLADRDFEVLRTPAALAFIEQLDLSVLLLTPLRTDGTVVPDIADGSPAADSVGAAMGELAGIDGLHDQPLTGSGWWHDLMERAGSGAARDLVGPVLHRWPSVVEQREQVRFGAAHGDWNPGNFAVADCTVAVWDWERFARGVPVGLDAQHLALQSALHAGMTPAEAATAVVAGAPGRLARFGLGPRPATIVAGLHLTELAIRYVEDGQRELGGRLGVVEDWAIPVITATQARLASPGSEAPA